MLIRSVLIPLLLPLGCPRPVTPPPAAETEARAPTAESPPKVAETMVLGRAELPGLAGLSCTDQGQCTVLVEGVLWRLDPQKLALTEELRPTDAERLLDHGGGQLLEQCEAGPCLRPLEGTAEPALLPDGPTTAEAPDRRWNEAIAAHWRSPFAALLPSPGGGRMSFVSTPQPRVLVTGGGVRQLPVEVAQASHRYLRALALHPTGREAYLVAWPGSELLAFDPDALRAHWRIPLHPAAHGLFVEPQGRLLLLEEGGTPDPDRLLDLGGDHPGLPPQADPSSDLFLALAQRPSATTTAVVDLAVPKLVWREDGRYLSLEALPDGSLLLATTAALVHLESPPLPQAPPQP